MDYGQQKKIVLGTAQFGMNYGITNISGQPTKKEVFNILTFAWKEGVRCFDTAPTYGSEVLLGEFVSTNGLVGKVEILTKIPSLKNSSNYQEVIRSNLESSLKNLGSIKVLFFHDPEDSLLILKDPNYFEKLLVDYPVSALGVSVYEPNEVKKLSGSQIELAFQFPLNVLDRRFEKVSLPQGKRYARSIFLQGLLASPNGLRLGAAVELLNLQKEYHDTLADHFIDPVDFSVSFVARNGCVDHFLIGVDSSKQLEDILSLNSYNQKDIAIINKLLVDTNEHWLDPRNWSSI